MNKEKDVPVGKKIMLAVKSLDMDDTVEIIRVKCVEDDDQNRCSECAFRHREECHIYQCYSVFRRDGKSVYFKKIEVVDEELNLNNKNMSREFNLDEAINGAKIQARNGYPARIICTDRKGGFPLIALLGADTGEIVMTYTECGRCNINAESSYDLVMSPTKKYINIFQDKDGRFHCSKRSYPTEEMAKELEGFIPRKYKGSRHVATVEIDE